MNMISKIFEQANAIGQCGLFEGTETIEDMVALFRSPQGQEFCLKHGFPNLETWRALNRKYDLYRFGIYVDAGDGMMTNDPHVALIGKTNGKLQYNELKRHNVILMHGARATIIAEKWAIVFVHNDKLSKFAKEERSNAKIL